MRQYYRTVLVIGDNPKDIIKKYSEDTLVNSHLFLKREDALKHKEHHVAMLENSIKSDFLSDKQKELTKEYIEILKEMDELEYFFEVTEGCTYDEKNGDAYTNKNSNAYYKYERSPQDVFEKTGEESGFCNPFKLKDDYISYSALKSEIDWSLNHLNNQEVYKSAWELVVEDREPLTENEKIIKEKMKNRINYFNNFVSKEDYILHSTAFWTYGIASEDFYKEVGMDGLNDKEWVKSFYDKFIKNLPDDTLLTLYEVQSID